MVAEKDDIMIDDEAAEGGEGKPSPAKGGGKKKLFILIGLVLILGAGGFFGYTLLMGGKGEKGKVEAAHEKEKGKPVLLVLEPFILNLAEPGRHLKVAVQLELVRKEDEEWVKEGTAKLRDAVILLLSSKTAEAVATPEGKFQLKDEILLRANQAMKKEVFKNVYFTEFVMQ
jgi:flagellar FliL protein